MGDLQLFSFIVNEENIDDTPLYTFKLPESVAKVFGEISQKDKNSAAYTTIFKIASCCFPEIIHCNNTLYKIKSDNYIWFYALKPFDLQVLKTKICEWLRIEYDNRLGRELKDKFEEDWQWEQSTSLKDILKGGKGVVYNLIPRYYMERLSKEVFAFECLGKNLIFHRVLGEDKAMIMTMPIELVGKRYSPFSYYIDSHLTLPIDGVGYCLNFWLHIKRWEDRPLITEERNYIAGKESTKAYVYKENPYYCDEKVLFNTISLERDKEYGMAYKETADKLYAEIMEIDLEEAITREGTNKGEEGEVILTTRKNKGKTLTQPGAGLPERNEMLALLQSKLPNLQLREQIQFLSKPSNSKLSKIVDSLEQLNELDIEPAYITGEKNNLKKEINKYSYISNGYYDQFKICVASSTEDLYSKVLEVCMIYLRLKQIEENKFANEEGKIIIIEQVNNEFCTPIESEIDKKEKAELIKQVFGEREKKELCLAIIDLPNYSLSKDWKKEKDPKSLIRDCCRRNKVLTQFIDYQDKDVIIDRVINAVKDLLSAAGFMEATIYKSGVILAEETLVGIAKVSTGENDNIVAMSKIVKGKMQLNIFGMNKWMSVQDYLFKLDRDMLKKIKLDLSKGRAKLVSQEINQWIKEQLTEILEEGNKIYAFVDYSLRNQLWHVAKNADFVQSNQLPIAGKERLRLIRINVGDEVPEYYITSQPDNLNKESGIFKGENSTYYLVGRRSGTDQTPKTLTKCEAPTKPMKRPALHEINVQGFKDEEDRDQVAILTQILRGMNISYDMHTALPLPIYCMGRLTEYIKCL